MTTLTSTTMAPTGRTRRPSSPYLRTGLIMLRVQALMAAGIWAVITLVDVGITRASAGARETVGTSIWENLNYGPRWFLFSMAIVLVTGYLAMHVASGLSRRSFATVVTLVMAVTSCLYALVWFTGFQVERLVFEGRGWPQGLILGHLFTSTSELALVALEALLLFAVYAASGMFVGVVYYRVGGWRGTLALPLTVGPALLADGLVSTRWTTSSLKALGLWVPTTTAGITIALLVLTAVPLVGAHLVLRTTPLSSKVS